MRILVIEDDKKIGSFIRKGLREAGLTVDLSNDGRQGLTMFLDNIYDAAVVDIMLPSMDGLTIIETIRNRGINTPILILSAKRTVDDRIKGLQQGGDDYMVKPSIADLNLDLLSREVTRQGQRIDLPAKEFSLLEYLVRNQGRIVSKTAILENVYDYSFDPQTNVVDVLVCRLRNKVDRDFDPKLIHTVRGMGYVLKQE
jgi:two-component system OmpR family response regulator